MQKVLLFGAVLAIIAIGGLSLGEESADTTSRRMLVTLKEGHPRLVLTDEGLARMKEAAASDAVFAGYWKTVRAEADAILTLPPLEHRLIGPRLLDVSREAVRRIYYLGLSWRMTGDEKYAAGAVDNMLTVCAFPDWNPSHFLDTAEMSHAVGIGYDWLYHYMNHETRDRIRAALLRLGLEEGIKAYDEEAWWTTSEFNWNQVCHGGLLTGALAVAETDGEIADKIVAGAVERLPLALGQYDPDGAWGEGVGYWNYATRYTCYGLSALETALGTDFGVGDREGLSKALDCPLYMAGPTGHFLTFADAGENSRARPEAAVFYLARRFGSALHADNEHALLARYPKECEPLHLVWYVKPGAGDNGELPLDKFFRGSVPVAVMRSAWGDENALFVGVKAGYNQVNHGHLDLGNFIVDALGVRWATDLGSDDYNLPDYWDSGPGGGRWQYYRLNSQSHNVPLIDGADQNAAAVSKVVSHFSDADSSGVVIDLSSAYPAATSVMRGVRMVGGRGAVLVQDEFDLAAPHEIKCGMTTRAKITLDGEQRATLTLDGHTLTATILSPEDAVLTVESAAQKPPEATNVGVSRLVVKVQAKEGRTTVALLLAPVWPDGTVETAKVEALGDWGR